MSAVIPDLWPADFGIRRQPSPAAILRQQGYLLGQKTRNAVIGEVSSESKRVGGFTHQLLISAPLLGYTQPVMHVEHGVEFYPSEAVFYNTDGSPRISHTVHTADEFMDVLKDELAAPELVRLIASLDAQCRDFESED